MAIIKVTHAIDRRRIKVLGVRFWLKHEYRKRVAANYQRKMRELRQKWGKETIRVGFIVRENSKWSYESLYHQLEQNPHYEPLVLIVETKSRREETQQNLHFYGNKRHCIIRSQKDYVRQNVDILFYEQPWYDKAGEFTPDQLSAWSLTYYVPYGIEIEQEDEIIAQSSAFYHALYQTFCFNERAAEVMAGYGIHNTCAAGHPRMDAYLTPDVQESPWKSSGKTRIIYAPHHSFGSSILKQGTWEWNGDYILQLARENQDTTEWIFKPHPFFQHELGRLLNSEKKAQQVMDDWAQVSQTYDRGNYFDLFKSADVMISDCVSFKMEWLPTGKPFIQLLSHYEGACEFADIEYYAQHYYHADSTEEIGQYFDMLVNKHEDPNREARLARAAEIPVGVAAKIIQTIERDMQ